ncbi:hypothetical protein CHCC20335_0287 [Bacillus paralicheniformis]|nr:hypothetical protein CHCC20335_0287 [Bacillus paralicheniformis]
MNLQKEKPIFLENRGIFCFLKFATLFVIDKGVRRTYII